MTITNDKERLSKEEILRMQQQAEMYRAEGKKHRESVASKNALELYCINIKQILEDPKVKNLLYFVFL